MAQITIKTEQESNRGWAFVVELSDNGSTQEYDVTLSWSDYDLWSHGRIAPERVVKAAFEFLLDNEPASSIMSRFDCAVIRRYFPHVDAELPKRL